MKIYRENKVCNCEPDQLAQMEKAGWSKDAPKAKTEQPKAASAVKASKS